MNKREKITNEIGKDDFEAKIVKELKKEGKTPTEIMKALHINYARYRLLFELSQKE